METLKIFLLSSYITTVSESITVFFSKKNLSNLVVFYKGKIYEAFVLSPNNKVIIKLMNFL